MGTDLDGAVEESERGAAVEHVEIEGVSAPEHLLDIAGDVLGVVAEIGDVPAMGNARPELHDEFRGLRTDFLNGVQKRSGMTRAVDGQKRLRKGSALHDRFASPVGDEKRNGDSGVPEEFVKMFQIEGVVSDGAVFIFDLHQHDGSAFGPLEFAELRQQNGEVSVHRIQIRRIAAADPQSRFVQQPGGQSAEVPFRADVGARTQDDHQSQRLRQTDIAFDVQSSGKLEASFRLLMQIPRQVGFHRVQSALFQFDQAILPGIRMDSEIVHRTGTENGWFPVHKECFFLNGYGMLHDENSFFPERGCVGSVSFIVQRKGGFVNHQSVVAYCDSVK